MLRRRNDANQQPDERLAGIALWPLAMWAWCPLVAVEFANNAHIDWLAVLFVVAALRSTFAGRPDPAGRTATAVFASLAVLTKIYPALVFPVILRRRPIRTLVIALAIAVLVYLPHVVAVGPKVIGYLPDYLKEEKYTSGGRFLLVGAVMPDGAAQRVAVVLALAAVAWAIWATCRKRAPLAPAHAATVLVGSVLCIATINYAWYSMLLLALAVFARKPEWLAVVFAPTASYLLAVNYDRVPLGIATYATALSIVLMASAYRRLAPGRPSTRTGQVSTTHAEVGVGPT